MNDLCIFLILDICQYFSYMPYLDIIIFNSATDYPRIICVAEHEKQEFESKDFKYSGFMVINSN